MGRNQGIVGTMVRRRSTRMAGALVLCVLLSGPAATVFADMGVFDWAYTRLDYARKEKVMQLRRFCNNVHALAERAAGDEVLIGFFDACARYHDLRRNGPAPRELTRRIQAFQKEMNHYYIDHYLAFYDLLFVDLQGEVFNSIRRESEYLSNIFSPAWSETTLGKTLRTKPQSEVFVDFHAYDPSNEPAAFFVEPIRKAGQPLGWLVLQLAANKVNSLFAGAERLGDTGETFLVNREGYLLTESGFIGHSTILEMRLDGGNVRSKFQERQGRKRVKDYRGFHVLTSFQVFDFLNASWLVVAKVDESQVITRHFSQHRFYYHEKIVERLGAFIPRTEAPETASPVGGGVIRVDMDEFVKADSGQVLKTVGVSTCTAVVAHLPGKFGYLAHISPFDKVYGGTATNVLGHIVKKIKTYDIYKYERRLVRFVVVAGHLNTLAAIVDKLVQEGFLLSQLDVMHHPGAGAANISYEEASSTIHVEWIAERPDTGARIQRFETAINLGALVREAIGS